MSHPHPRTRHAVLKYPILVWYTAMAVTIVLILNIVEVAVR